MHSDQVSKNSFHSNISKKKLSILSDNPAYEQNFDEMRAPPLLIVNNAELEEVKDPEISASEKDMFQRMQEIKQSAGIKSRR